MTGFEILSRHAATNVEELTAALASLLVTSGEHPATIYLATPLRLTLEEERLSDGSTVHNLRIEERA